MEETEIKQKSNKGLIILVVVLLIIILGMGTYIAYDKGIIFSNNKEEVNETKSDETKIKTDLDKEIDTEIKELDLSKSLNSSDIKYSNASDIAGNYGLSMEINDDKKSITLSIDWEIFGPISGASMWPSDVETYQITGFSKNVKDTFVGDVGQDAKGITLFYLMNDGTVEYTPMFVLKYDSQNNSYYNMNYTYDYSSDGKATGEHFATVGSLTDVRDVIKIYNVDASNTTGWRTTIGATKDGSFYDLGHVMNNN